MADCNNMLMRHKSNEKMQEKKKQGILTRNEAGSQRK